MEIKLLLQNNELYIIKLKHKTHEAEAHNAHGHLRTHEGHTHRATAHD